MARAPHALLARFPALKTRELAAAREATTRFWPKHTSATLGPDDYAVEMNRVVLGHVAVTYVACTSRIRVVSAAPATEYALYLPLSGDIRLVVDGLEMTASAERPLLRGPARTFVFEPSPMRCLVIDIPAAVLVPAMGGDFESVRHASIAPPHATSLVRLNRAHTILAGPVADVTVADVAAAVGYTHLGRFADEYRRHVGELPSQTLARGRSGGAL